MDEYSSPTAAQRASNVQLAASLAAEAADLLRNANVEGLAHKARELAYECETAGAFIGRAAADLSTDTTTPCPDCGRRGLFSSQGRFVPHATTSDGPWEECPGGGPIAPKPRQTAQCGDCGQSIRVEHGHFVPHGDGRPDERSCEGSGKPPHSPRGPVNAGVTPLRSLSNDDYGA